MPTLIYVRTHTHAIDFIIDLYIFYFILKMIGSWLSDYSLTKLRHAANCAKSFNERTFTELNEFRNSAGLQNFLVELTREALETEVKLSHTAQFRWRRK